MAYIINEGLLYCLRTASIVTRMNVPYPTARAPIHYRKGKQVVNLLLQSSHIEMKTEKAYPLLSSS